MTPLVKVIVRAKSDADAVENSISRFLEGEAELDTLRGARTAEDVDRELRRHLGFKGPVVLLLGLQDRAALSLRDKYPPNFIFHLIPKSKVRNERPHRLLLHYLDAKAEYRMRLRWSDERSAYVLGGDGRPLEDWEVNPRFDVYLATEGMARAVEGLGAPRPGLMVKKLGGVHVAYRGPTPIAKLSFSYQGLSVEVERLGGPSRPIEELSIEEHAKLNREELSRLVEASLGFLSGFSADHVVVPWSGGKDSTAALLMAVKAFGGRVTPIFVDTGLEFKETLEYVDDMARRLGIGYVRLRARVREALVDEGRPLPTHDNRWCTGLKVEAVERYVEELARSGSVLLIVGDREAESDARLYRPAVTRHERYLEVAPLKLWGAIHVQLFLAMEGAPLNPMYELGFFRIGCYICPALRSWEARLMLERPELAYLHGEELFKRFIEHRGAASSGEFSSPGQR